MKMKQLTTTLVALAVLVLPAVSLASTYQYVNSAGALQSTEANSSAEALAIASNLGIHSGVMLLGTNGIGGIGGNLVLPVTNTGGNFYQYIDANGNVQSLNAVNSSVALANAYNIGANSGVILVTNSTALNN